MLINKSHQFIRATLKWISVILGKQLRDHLYQGRHQEDWNQNWSINDFRDNILLSDCIQKLFDINVLYLIFNFLLDDKLVMSFQGIQAQGKMVTEDTIYSHPELYQHFFQSIHTLWSQQCRKKLNSKFYHFLNPGAIRFFYLQLNREEPLQLNQISFQCLFQVFHICELMLTVGLNCNKSAVCLTSLTVLTEEENLLLKQDLEFSMVRNYLVYKQKKYGIEFLENIQDYVDLLENSLKEKQSESIVQEPNEDAYRVLLWEKKLMEKVIYYQSSLDFSSINLR
ncbi:Hypothetical protein PP7435_CHR1-2148 [Komagataella phaffii CBS 7435]|uniref:Uncharacterized protein n=2 Tax=Komagataella phaffii TaxID=460519 RepID=C4QWH5_KOMPG|nr:Hypothetical protein PAS_chr1-1_0229 [Komagataella phaffii GS115]AOA61709.1 GQ67_02811T0 [Komagataella phaffii]CAH2446277.1 Hypothetical protein BQ9382_C1-2802 [Komagataella phaffii CBS 7435]AOA65428.1 GQ68_02437T0 [Komagataella phaffii GS115]CAY67598.1 Hypothetical protein PAS_chr1-1_0229 [Komagataella phaffii GS115]SCV11814.1 Hypothetical protein PP7435_CHR1-2148 [Komagataella phaffii CBS 7435]